MADTEDMEVEAPCGDLDGVVVVDDTAEENEIEITNPKAQLKPGDVVWQVRVCPILFEDLCSLSGNFTKLIKMSIGFEFRMSKHLSSFFSLGKFFRKDCDKDIPWLPNEKTYTKPLNAATAGMLEMKVKDHFLVEVIRNIRTAELSKKNRMRFELKRLFQVPVKQKEREGERKQEGETEQEGETKQEGEKEQEGDTKQEGEKEQKGEEEQEGKTKQEEEEKMEGEETMEGEEMMEGDKKMEREGKTEESNSYQILVNFAVRLKPVKMLAFNHEEGHKANPEDNQIFLSKIPDEVPDNVLEAILLSDMMERKKGENDTGTATFNVKSPLGAQGFMELFDGIIVNDTKDIEMSTTLGTLYEAKRKHVEKQQENRAANVKHMQARKRKQDSSSTDGQEAKKPRREPLSATAEIWLSGRNMIKGMGDPHTARGGFAFPRGTRGAMMQGRGGVMLRGPTRGARGRPVIRPGIRGLGVRGGPSRGMDRGAAGMARRGLQRGAPRGRGVLRGKAQGASPRGLGAQGGSRGFLGERSAPRGAHNPRAVRGLLDVDVMPARRERGMPRRADFERGFQRMDRGRGYRDESFSSRRSFGYRMDPFMEDFDDRYRGDMEFRDVFGPGPRKRW